MSDTPLLARMCLWIKQSLSWTIEHIVSAILGVFVLSFLGLAVVDTSQLQKLLLWSKELGQQPTPLWVAIALPAAVYLLLKTEIYRASKSPKINTPKPNLSKKTELQESILKCLENSQTEMPGWIAKELRQKEQLVLHQLALLQKDQLVVPNGHNSSGWRLTEHGRAYLYP